MATTCRCSEILIYDFDTIFRDAMYSMKSTSFPDQTNRDRIEVTVRKFWDKLIDDDYITDEAVDYITDSVDDKTLNGGLSQLKTFLRDILEDFISMEPYTPGFVYNDVKFVKDDYFHNCDFIEPEHTCNCECDACAYDNHEGCENREDEFHQNIDSESGACICDCEECIINNHENYDEILCSRDEVVSESSKCKCPCWECIKCEHCNDGELCDVISDTE